MGTSLCVQDHVVLLLSLQEFENPPSWLSDNFKILEGGVHAARSSRNKLIVFADGSYLELFCWIDTPREFHAWANKSPGLIDFALTSMPPSTAQSYHDGIVSRLGNTAIGEEIDLEYTFPEAGSRVNGDDVLVKWESSRPISSKSVGRTDFPFFCHDVTSRSVRVPFDDAEETTHPCGAIGISSVVVIVPNSRFDEYAELYGLTLGASPKYMERSGEAKRLEFDVGLPVPKFSSSTISLRSEKDELDQDWLRDRGSGIRSLVLSVAGRKGHGREALGNTGIASTIALRW